VPYFSFLVIKNKKMNMVGLLEGNESGQIAATTFVCFRGAQPDLHFIRFIGLKMIPALVFQDWTIPAEAINWDTLGTVNRKK